MRACCGTCGGVFRISKASTRAKNNGCTAQRNAGEGLCRRAITASSGSCRCCRRSQSRTARGTSLRYGCLAGCHGSAGARGRATASRARKRRGARCYLRLFEFLPVMITRNLLYDLVTPLMAHEARAPLASSDLSFRCVDSAFHFLPSCEPSSRQLRRASVSQLQRRAHQGEVQGQGQFTIHPGAQDGRPRAQQQTRRYLPVVVAQRIGGGDDVDLALQQGRHTRTKAYKKKRGLGQALRATRKARAQADCAG